MPFQWGPVRNLSLLYVNVRTAVNHRPTAGSQPSCKETCLVLHGHAPAVLGQSRRKAWRIPRHCFHLRSTWLELEISSIARKGLQVEDDPVSENRLYGIRNGAIAGNGDLSPRFGGQIAFAGSQSR